MSFDNNLEGVNITRNMWYAFWNPEKETFTSLKAVNGTIGGENKFNVWSVSVAVHAIVDAARVAPEFAGPLIDQAIKAMNKYRSPQYGGYCAFENYDGNNDIYYDDDAQVASALICAYEVTGNQEYLKLGTDLVHFLMGGYNNDKNSKAGGGMKWHVSKDYCNTCTTSECAVAAMRLAKFVSGNEQRELYEYAKKCINWVFDKMIDPEDKLVWDGVGKDSDNPDTMKYTYNIGTTLTAVCMLYQYDHDSIWVDRSKVLAEGATDRGRWLFCRDYGDWKKRFWRDPSYFVQLLIEGLADYIETFGNIGPEQTVSCCKNEIIRHLSYFRKYNFDPKDGLYYMTFENHRLDKERYQRYRDEFGESKGFDPWGEDRASGDGHPGDRPMAKCLIGCASAARIFLQGARVAQKMDPVDG
ncbi:unnamed protein product [[Candida] boidinii]|uniref:Unnamed protein product n=1 Tax=Candida boidinii TaxID=5477 RepID=A0A9W6SWC7_CANBO|nr:hypothetical protein BVG19_g3311 [[Candida] boidinii]OWB52148.1 hypothetical protein B5S27_g3720 [[Candida] boidinii]OWB68525.1 hypothetical protein B5S30_g3906 [[Candida] boidinii]OWB85478.1 hypothetical protein B5S33_g4145 [[Candida] boidinii]GME68166.1 unnamed protein product [[Candida] boidinii]